ncbi:methyltransferase, FxLD system [Streptomyces sp. AM 4-1-1]|uniref:methyltransferase, FxLD system n=1 Tax=Streptomyces sp. AM 4-1-1 TaxID=3028710 RepID=UPI0023B8EAE9|nr:methyltransferase, FxLD system [Streptomyces sp. AM 4-1-1]WEH31954.1 methyltransferase, FxLD system [Streptomyces sp. AM 4-1-1]
MTTVRDSSVGDAASLRSAMVGELRGEAITSEAVTAAFTAVPRHLFAVGEPLRAAYEANRALVIKRTTDGEAISSLSAAHIQAVMLEQAAVEPGMRVLEVGSGGYNAALLQELVGPSGKVVSVDIDPEIVERARGCLAEAGYDRVEVVLADAENGVPHGAPYDRIVVTAGAWDIPPAWVEQLAPAGRIVVPLRLKGLTRSIAFDRTSSGLQSSSYRLCGFVPMQGDGAGTEQRVPLSDGADLWVEGEAGFDIEALREAVRSAQLERWSGAAFDLPDELELFLMTSAPGVVLLRASTEAAEQGLFALSATRGVPALISGGSFAYRIKRPNEATGGFESGVLAYGPEAEDVAARYVDLLRRWASDHRRRGAARIQYIPRTPATTTTTGSSRSSGLIVKRHGVVEVAWQ